MATLPKVLISRADYQIGGGVALGLRTQGSVPTGFAFACQTLRAMLNIRFPIFVAAGLVILAAVATAQPPATPMKMLDDVRDRRYCELIVVKRHGVGFSADVYNPWASMTARRPLGMRLR
jgi:hypothetical protein